MSDYGPEHATVVSSGVQITVKVYTVFIITKRGKWINNAFFLLEDYGTPSNDFEDTTNNSNQVTSTDVTKEKEDSITVSIYIVFWFIISADFLTRHLMSLWHFSL